MFSRIEFNLTDQSLVLVNQVLVEENIYFPALSFISESSKDVASTLREHVNFLDR